MFFFSSSDLMDQEASVAYTRWKRWAMFSVGRPSPAPRSIRDPNLSPSATSKWVPPTIKQLSTDSLGEIRSKKSYCSFLSKWEFFIKMRAALLAPILPRVMEEGESKKAALILMKNSHFDRTLRSCASWQKFGGRTERMSTNRKQALSIFLTSKAEAVYNFSWIHLCILVILPN